MKPDRLESVASIDGTEVIIDQPLTVIDPCLNLWWWGFAGLRAARVGAVSLLYSPPHMIQVRNDGDKPIAVTLPIHHKPIAVEPNTGMAAVLLADGTLDVENPQERR